uniref:ATP-binding cassette domain-containing protein n=1 Tax=candidate division WOR-3 bacterium TaxID=2052148 RepID=A0A7C4Y611_UNCW3
MEKGIIIKNLTKIFKKRKGEVRAVDCVHFEINEGEIFGLLGPNGAGKTTLIKCISTLLIPDNGTAIVGGYDVLKDSLNVRRKIGLLTGGERSLYWKLSVLDNLNYFGALYGVPKMELKERIEFLLNLMDLKDKANERVERLSSGMKQKLSIARALIHNPPILLIDEPTIGLDPYFARFIRNFIKEELNEKLKKTILLTTHYMDEAEELCHRIGFMSNGKIVKIGTTDELKRILGKENILEIKCIGNVDKEIFKDFIEINKVNISNVDGFTYIRINTEKPESLLNSIIERISGKTKILGINFSEFTLEDVFVYMTGQSLKEGYDEDNNRGDKEEF